MKLNAPFFAKVFLAVLVGMMLAAIVKFCLELMKN